MVKNGNITLIGEIRGLKPARLGSDPQEGDLREGLVWVNTTDKALRWFDGAAVHTLAHGGNLDEYLNLAGGTLTGPLVLAGEATEANHPTTLGQVETLLEAKQNNITGAASTILTENLGENIVAVSDAQGKLVSSEITVAELNHLDGVEDNVQVQINSKQANLGYAPVDREGDTMTGDLVFGGNHTVTGLRAPSQPTDAIRLIDIDNLKADLDFQADVLYIQTDETLEVEADYELPDHQVRIVVTDTATLSETFGVIEGLGNGDIIVKNGEQWEVAYDVSEQGPGVLVWARDLEKFMKFDGTQWNEHGGLSGVTATGGLSKEGNTIRVETGAGVTLLPAGYVGLSLRGTSPLRLVDSETGDASTAANAVLDIVHGESLSRVDGVLRVASSGVRAAHLNGDIVGFGLSGAEGSALSIKLDGTTLEVDESGLRLGDVSDQYLHFETGGTVTGELHVAKSTADTHAVQKVYVDTVRQNLNNSLTALTQRFTDSLFIYDGLGEVASGAYTIEHNLGTRGVTVAVYDEDYHQIMPDGIELATINSVVITLATPQRVYVVIHGVKAAAPNPVSSVTLPAGGDVVLTEGESYKFSVQYAGTGVGFLEMDINITSPALPELARTQYTLSANAADPYNGAAADFATQGVTVTYNEVAKRWDIDFGLSITEAMVNSGTVRLYSVLRDANGNILWGDMNNVTPEMRVAVNISRA